MRGQLPDAARSMNRLPLVTIMLAGLQIADHLDEIAIGEAGLDLAQFDRLVLMRDPDPDLVAFVDQRLLRHADRRMVARPNRS